MDGNSPSGFRKRALALLQRAGWFFSGMAVLGACLAYKWYEPADSASAKPPVAKTSTSKSGGPVQRVSATQPIQSPVPPKSIAVPQKNPVAALVNNEPIKREELANDCLLHYGSEVLEALVNRMLIESSCKQRNIVITDKQVEDEIDRMARKFSMAKDQWMAVLAKERGIDAARYSRDIVWPTLALRELARDQLKVSKQELDDAYEGEFGPAVKVRLIAMDKAEEAKKVHAQATAKPEEFAGLAKKYSKDANSASSYGLIQPIRRHMGDPKLEEAAFALKKGEVSKIVQVGELYVFVKCEEQIPPPKGIDRAKVEPHLIDAIKERKLRTAANDVFKQLQSEAQVENIYNDPVKSKAMPGVAAIINGRKITIRELAEECLDRHGRDVLEGSVNRRIIDQALRKHKLTVTDEDINEEIARAAQAMGKVKSNGEPDVEGWIEYVTTNENVSREVYVRDEVWPSAGLKKLVGKKVEVTQEDLKRGFDANYGAKIQCRAIVLNNERRAKEVWEMARENPTDKNFGDLAEQYSIEAGSRSLRGEVPPIQQHGGQPTLEKEAFTLSEDNPLSGIIQVGGTYVILFYQGKTRPIDASFAEVKDMIYRDIHEKKLRVAMGKAFDNLREVSHVDNFITGNIKVAKQNERPEEPPVEPKTQMPKVQKR